MPKTMSSDDDEELVSSDSSVAATPRKKRSSSSAKKKKKEGQQQSSMLSFTTKDNNKKCKNGNNSKKGKINKKQVKNDDTHSDEELTEDDNDEELSSSSEDKVISRRPRLKRGVRTESNNAQESKDNNVRRSSRSNMFKCSLQEPNASSLTDFFPISKSPKTKQTNNQSKKKKPTKKDNDSESDEHLSGSSSSSDSSNDEQHEKEKSSKRKKTQKKGNVKSLTKRKSQRTITRSKKNESSNNDDESSDSTSVSEQPIRNKPKRNTRKKPQKSAVTTTTSITKRPRAAKKKKSVIDESDESTDIDDILPHKKRKDDDSEHDQDSPVPSTPIKNTSSSNKVKSPAVKRKSRRHVVHVEVPVSSNSSDNNDDGDDDDSSEVDEDYESEEELKVGRIVASKTETLKKWNEICKAINTSEIEEGSRWFQASDASKKDNEGDSKIYEERFLIKWDDLSYLHCSWETERDLLDQIERAKTMIKTFFKKAINGYYYDVDERGDGEFFDPGLTQIERILELADSDNENSSISNTSDKTSSKEKHGIIMDTKHPDYQSGTGRQFLVKWAGADYVAAKFEFERDLLLNDIEYEEHLESFMQRNKKPSNTETKKLHSSSDQSCRKLYKVFGEKFRMKGDEKEKKIKVFQEKLMSYVFKNGGSLRDYQVEGISWLLSNYLNKRNSILADEMGLGKTIQTVVYINSVANTLHKRGPFLVVAPLSTIAHWYREFTGWTNLNTIVYHGSAKNREHIREFEFAFEKDRPRCVGLNQSFLKKCHRQNAQKWEKTWMVDVVITTPELLVADDYAELSHVPWEVLVVDEAHRMKNNTSRFASNLREGRFKFERSLLLTGTPIQNNMNELWALLNFIDSETFESVDKFLESYGTITEKEQMDDLHESIRPYILRRLKEDVEKSVPPKEETVVEVELTILQKQYYRALYEKNVQFLHRNHRKALDGPSINNLAMQLRKCCNHPYLLRGVELEVRTKENKANGGVEDEADFLVRASGKLVFLDKLLPWLRDDGHRVLIFSQFKIMLDILEDYLNLRQFKYERIDGSITGHKRQNAIDRFQSKGDPKKLPFVMMLSTRAGGVGINLTAADTVVIFDSDWNPQNDLQAQARCHRIGQTKDVKVYRLLTRKTYELQMFHMSSLKMGLDQAVLQGLENNSDNTMTKEQVEKLLRHGAYDIFNEEKTGTANKESEEFMSQDINSILERRTKVVVHGGKEEKQGGSTFSKATFKAGNSDGVEADNVDVDDPEFWTKVVGEAKKEEDTLNLQSKKRKRKANYTEFFNAGMENGISSEESEAEVDSEGDSNDDDDFLLPENYIPEPTKWGGSKKSAIKVGSAENKETTQNGNDTVGNSHDTRAVSWERNDVESVVFHMQKYGYHNENLVKVNQTAFIAKALSYPQLEVQRMCWSIVLMCLYESAIAEAREPRKETKPIETKPIENKAPENADSSSKVISISDSSAIEAKEDPAKKKEAIKLKRESKFNQLYASHRSWIVQAIVDANAFAASSNPRPAKVIDARILSKLTTNAIYANSQTSAITEVFNKNVWPQLRSRGWISEEVKGIDGNPSSIRYKYNTSSYTQIRIILQIAPVLHPELTALIDNVQKSINSGSATSPSTAAQQSLIDKLDPNYLNLYSLQQFLFNFAPLQFLKDRNRENKISLPAKLLKICFYMSNARILISPLVSPTKECLYNQINQLSKAIVRSKELILPPVPWTRTHDGIFIRAMLEHGWIESSYKEVNDDIPLVWNSIKDIVQKKEEADAEEVAGEKVFSEDEKLKFRDVAGRALQFFVAYDDEFIKSTKGFDRDRVFKTYGMTWDDSSYIIDESLLEKSHFDAQKALNSLRIEKRSEKPINKLELLKRARAILSSDQKLRADAVAANTWVNSEANNYGFPLLDDTDPCNALLAEMLRGLVKLSLVKPDDVSTFKKLIRLARSEAQYLMDSTIKVVNDDMRRIERCIHAVDLRFRPNSASTSLKNVLKVMVGIKPTMPKGPQDMMFPDFRIAVTGASVDSSPMNVKKDTEKVAKKGNKRENAAGENSLNRALAAVNQSKIDTSQSGVMDTALNLPLSYLEALLLTVMLSSGIPCTEDHNEASSNGSDEELSGDVGQEFRISWKTLAGVLEVAAKRWYSRSSQKRTQTNKATSSSVNEEDLAKKRRAVDEASELTKNPLNFARRSVMLLEALRIRMGPVEISQGGSLKKIRSSYKSELSLGPRVLTWYKKELLKLSMSLDIVNKRTQLPYNSTAHDLSNRTEFYPAAYLDKKSCRLIFGQITQLSRLRSLFVKYGSKGVAEQVPKAVKNCKSNGDVWVDRPSWWSEDDSNRDDFDLLLGLLNLGFSNFDHMNIKNDSFRTRKEECTVPSTFNSASIQQRVNGLTRELSALDDTAEMIRKLHERQHNAKQSKQGNTLEATTEESAKTSHSTTKIQPAIDAFFRSSNKKKSPNSTTESTETDNSVVLENGVTPQPKTSLKGSSVKPDNIAEAKLSNASSNLESTVSPEKEDNAPSQQEPTTHKISSGNSKISIGKSTDVIDLSAS